MDQGGILAQSCRKYTAKHTTSWSKRGRFLLCCPKATITNDRRWTNVSRFSLFRLERMLLPKKLSYLLLVSTCKQPNELLNSPTAGAVPLLFILNYSVVKWVLLRGSSGHNLLALFRVCMRWCMKTCIDF